MPNMKPKPNPATISESIRQRTIEDIRQGIAEIEQAIQADVAQYAKERTEKSAQEIAELRKMLADLDAAEGDNSRAQVPAAPKASKRYLGPPGEYLPGMEKGQALLKYMTEHSDQGPISVSKIRKDLLAAGVFLGKLKRKYQTLQTTQEATLLITARNYPQLDYDPENRTIWMKKRH